MPSESFARSGAHTCLNSKDSPGSVAKHRVTAMVQNWRAKSRTLMGLLVGALVAWTLHGIGWPWWAWLPAGLLSVVGFYTLSVLTWFAYRKLTYQHFARLHKRERQAEQ